MIWQWTYSTRAQDRSFMGDVTKRTILPWRNLKQKPPLWFAPMWRRGIDVNNLTHVINYGLPQELDSSHWSHRSCRMKGIAISLVDSRDMYSIRRLEKMLEDIKRKDLLGGRFEAMCAWNWKYSPIFTALQDKKVILKLMKPLTSLKHILSTSQKKRHLKFFLLGPSIKS